jgi:hypothetical protein
VVVYVALVATLMFNAEQLFGQGDTVITGISFLLLFCVSAATVGMLVFGHPVMLFLDGKKRQAVLMAGYTIAWLAIETMLAMSLALALRT